MSLRSVFAAFLLALSMVTLPAWSQDEPAEGSDSEPVETAAPEGDLNRDLRTVEEEVNNLKERVFRSKATLQLLKELVVEGSSGGSRVAIWHNNEMGGNYTLESVQYFLDGKNVFTKVDPGGELAAIKELKIHEQGLSAGTHNLQVKMVLRGNGSGLFSYLKTYQFNVQSSYAFKVEDGKLSVIKAIATTRGGLRTFEERPSVTYEERTDSIREQE